MIKKDILSLFDGMSCGQITLTDSNIKFGKYYASEIDKFAIQQTQHNFENTIQLGSVENWREWDLDWSNIGLILAGSPCQGFSFAGKQLNFEDERSKLFFVFVDILKHVKKHNPDVKFLLENVNMKKEYQKVINDCLGVFPVRINSNLVSAQNRDRLYWSNIRIKQVGLFNEIHTDIPQPENRGILLKDILQYESEVDEKYYIKNPKVDFEGMDINGKCNNLRVGGHASQSKKHNFDIIKLDKQLNKKASQNKASCLTGGGHSGGNHSDMDIICLNYKAAKHQQDRIYSDIGKAPAMTVSNNNDKRILTKNIMRRLTPLECSRLQTIPEWYKWIVSDTQTYKMLGNGWTIEVIKHILKYL